MVKSTMWNNDSAAIEFIEYPNILTCRTYNKNSDKQEIIEIDLSKQDVKDIICTLQKWIDERKDWI